MRDPDPVPTEITIRDLQNSRQVLAAAGHTSETYVDAATGRVCLDGALKLATTCQLKQEPPLRTVLHPRPARVWMLIDRTDPDDRRYTAAVNALTPLLPTTCAAREHGSGCPCGAGSPRALIWNFNDYLCDGGDAADLVLEQAIQKLEASVP